MGAADQAENYDNAPTFGAPPGGGSSSGSDKPPFIGGYDESYFALREFPSTQNYGFRGDDPRNPIMMQRPGPPVTEQVSPDYRAGDQFSIGQGRSERWILGVQRRMERAGLIDSDQYIPGFWDNYTVGAMEDLMSYANAQGYTWEEILQQIEDQGGMGGDGGRSMRGGGLQKVTHVPEWALASMLDEAGTQYLGRSFTDAEKQQFISSFRGLENADAAVDMQTAVSAFAQRSDPTAYAANQVVDLYDSMLQTLTGGAF